MAGIAAYGLYLQLGAHMLHDDLQERIGTIARRKLRPSPARSKWKASRDASAARIEAVLQRPTSRAVIALVAERVARVARLPESRRSTLVKAAGGKDFGGIVEFENKIWIAAATCKSERTQPFCILAGTPLNSAFLDGLSSEIGPIEIIPLRQDSAAANGD